MVFWQNARNQRLATSSPEVYVYTRWGDPPLRPAPLAVRLTRHGPPAAPVPVAGAPPLRPAAWSYTLPADGFCLPSTSSIATLVQASKPLRSNARYRPTDGDRCPSRKLCRRAFCESKSVLLQLLLRLLTRLAAGHNMALCPNNIPRQILQVTWSKTQCFQISHTSRPLSFS